MNFLFARRSEPRPRRSPLARATLASALGLLALLAPPGCDGGDARLRSFVAMAPTNRAGAATALAGAYRQGHVSFMDAFNLAFDKLDAGEDATALAGAVLDAAVQIEDLLAHGAEFEIFWRRVGQLAARAAQAAVDRGRWDEARTLVLAGPKRWQNESYWRAYPGHDGLASLILANTGDRDEAIRRLQSRPHLEGDAEMVLEFLRTGKAPPP